MSIQNAATSVQLKANARKIKMMEAEIESLIGNENYVEYRKGVSEMIALSVSDLPTDERRLKQDELDIRNMQLLGSHATQVLEIANKLHHLSSANALLKLRSKGKPNETAIIEAARLLPKEQIVFDAGIMLALFGPVSVGIHIPRYDWQYIDVEEFNKMIHAVTIFTSADQIVRAQMLFLHDAPVAIIRRSGIYNKVYVLNALRFHALGAQVATLYKAPAPKDVVTHRLGDEQYPDLFEAGWIDQLMARIESTDDTPA